MNKQDIIKAIEKDEWMMSILRIARELNLPDWMIGSGFVRGKVWDVLHEHTTRTNPSDIDLIYFDLNKHKTSEREIEQRLENLKLELNWEVVNQATAHIYNDEKPYVSSEDALSKWPETATSIAVRLNRDDGIELFAPHGVEDLVNMVVRPTPAFLAKIEKFRERVGKKNWQEKWPKIKVQEF